IHRMIKPSAQRVNAVCSHSGYCGVCKWQNMSYQSQLQFIQKYVYDAYTRIRKLEYPEMTPIHANKEPYFYRNKLEFSFSNKKWLTPEEMATGEEIKEKNALGFHVQGMFDKILDIEHCHLQPVPSNEIRNSIREYAL